MRKKHQTARWQRWIKQNKIRVTLCAVLVAALYLTPLLTQAQYKWTLNGYSTIQAKEYYFSSNILKDQSVQMQYPMSGWNGKTRDLPNIWIDNYENALLANKTDEDTSYTFTWKITTNRTKSNGADYTLQCKSYTFTDSANGTGNSYSVSQGNGLSGSATSTIIGNGNPKKDTYQLQIIQPGNDTDLLTAGESVTITLTATAGNENTYSKTLTATYTYIVSAVEDYVAQFDMQEDTTAYTTLKLGTGIKPLGASNQSVVVWWDTEKLKINTFNYVFLEANRQGHYTTVTNEGKTYGVLTLSGLGDSSYRELEFEKLGADNTTSWFTDGTNVGRNTDYRTYKTGDTIAYIGFYVESDGTSEGTN